MKITYTIQVCNESRELYSLLNFILKVKDEEDNINVVVDSLHTTEKVKMVLDHFKDRITVFERPFDNFYENATFHNQKATGDYIFGIDADEMPQEGLIKGLKKLLTESDIDILFIPRINIHPGSTKEFSEKMGFNINRCGWINWPDYQGRVYKNSPEIQWTNELHTKLSGSEKVNALGAEPELALWHIKSVEKQESRWVNNDITSPTSGNLYDLLM
jgi:hypothetical protein